MPPALKPPILTWKRYEVPLHRTAFPIESFRRPWTDAPVSEGTVSIPLSTRASQHRFPQPNFPSQSGNGELCDALACQLGGGCGRYEVRRSCAGRRCQIRYPSTCRRSPSCGRDRWFIRSADSLVDAEPGVARPGCHAGGGCTGVVNWAI